MILVISHKQDYTADFVVNKLNKRGISYRRFNCEDILLSNLTLRFQTANTEYSILGEDHYDSVWFRRTKLPELKGLSDEQKFFVLGETEALLRNLFLIIDAKWLSPPDLVYRAENKLLQLKTAKKIGFSIPNTLVTNSKSELKDFFSDNKKNIIIKPLSQTRIPSIDGDMFIFTNKLPETLIDSLPDVDLTPCIFQENIGKTMRLGLLL